MKKIYQLLIISFLCISNTYAQSIKCNEICILNIEYDSINKEIDVDILNGPNGSQINYPIVVVTNSLGDTIANKTAQFYYFAHLTGDTMMHGLPTALTSLATNFTGTVYISSPNDSITCNFSYPMNCSVGINEYAQSNFSIYPNPAIDNITIDFPELNNSKTTIRIYDITGKQVEIIETNNSKTLLKIQNYKSGVYFISASLNAGKMVTKKFIVLNQ